MAFGAVTVIIQAQKAAESSAVKFRDQQRCLCMKRLAVHPPPLTHALRCFPLLCFKVIHSSSQQLHFAVPLPAHTLSLLWLTQSQWLDALFSQHVCNYVNRSCILQNILPPPLLHCSVCCSGPTAASTSDAT